MRHQYASLGRVAKGLVRRMTGLNRAQVTRLIAGCHRTGLVKAVAYQRARFAKRYTAADVRLLGRAGNIVGKETHRPVDSLPASGSLLR